MEKIVSWLLDFLMTLPVILISLSVHEWMHGFAADRLGDPTARQMGRLSLNPLHHIDPIGFLFLIFFHFGWAKPVMVDSRYFKKPKRDMALTALAGPLSNFLLAFLSSFLYVLIYKVALQFVFVTSFSASVVRTVMTMAGYMVTINLGLGVFNLVPIPPLDGSKVLYSFLPYQVIVKIMPYERYLHLGLILLLAVGVLSVPINSAVSFFYRLFIGIAQEVLL